MSQPTLKENTPKPSLWQRVLNWPSSILDLYRVRRIFRREALQDIDEQRQWFVNHWSEVMQDNELYNLGSCNDGMLLFIQYDGTLFKEYIDNRMREGYARLEPKRCSLEELYEITELLWENPERLKQTDEPTS